MEIVPQTFHWLEMEMRYEIREIYDLYKNAYEQNARIYSDESPNLDNRAETQYQLHSIPYLQGILYQLAN